jgi:hypothetical protein
MDPISKADALRLHGLILEMKEYRDAGPLGDDRERLERFNHAYQAAVAILAPAVDV